MAWTECEKCGGIGKCRDYCPTIRSASRPVVGDGGRFHDLVTGAPFNWMLALLGFVVGIGHSTYEWRTGGFDSLREVFVLCASYVILLGKLYHVVFRVLIVVFIGFIVIRFLRS